MAADYKSAYAFSQPRMGHRNDRGLDDIGVAVQHILDLFGAYVFAAAYDQILFAARDQNRAVRRDDAEIAGLVETVLGQRSRGLSGVEIAEHHRRAARGYLTLLSRRDICAVVVQDTHFVIFYLFVSGRGELGFGLGQEAHCDQRCIGAAINAEGRRCSAPF
jgi:hypothetical protein